VCGKLPEKQRFAIDHDHKLGKGRHAVRGLLCKNCNYNRLPMFQENTEMLRKAARYLERPPGQEALMASNGKARAVQAPWGLVILS
jgi:hypothetical protein